MRKFVCLNKRCKHEQYFNLPNQEEQYPLCPCCDKPMKEISDLVEDDIEKRMEAYLFDAFYKHSPQTVFKMIETYTNPLIRAKYRKVYFKLGRKLGYNIWKNFS